MFPLSVKSSTVNICNGNTTVNMSAVRLLTSSADQHCNHNYFF